MIYLFKNIYVEQTYNLRKLVTYLENFGTYVLVLFLSIDLHMYILSWIV